MAKLYYTTQEVADMLGVPLSTIRYWTTEFAVLKKTDKRHQQYTDKDIEKLKRIYVLMKVQKVKIEVAKETLRSNPHDENPKTLILEKLLAVKEELTTLKQKINTL